MGTPWNRPRFTLRRLMVAVAVVAVVLTLVVWMQRRAELFRRKAQRHNEVWFTHAPVSPNGPILRIDYHAKMAAKYEAATRFPWLPVEPDPPEPQ